MNDNRLDPILASIKAPLDHPLFYPRIFALVAKEKRQERSRSSLDEVSVIFEEEYEELSRRLDRSQIQESSSVRNVLRTRRLVQLLIDSKGELRFDLLENAISALQQHLYSLGPLRQYDAKRQEHILKILKLLYSNKELSRFFKKFSRPFSNLWMEELIRDTLQLPNNMVITDVHAKQAVLAAWLCYLRQNVGSCFATAPAEIVHDEQPELFLQDLLNLLETGRLKRVFNGLEYSVPLSASWGSGDLNKPLFIQSLSKGLFPEIWFSPGLVSAFDAIGFFDSTERLKEKIKKLERWIKPVIQQRSYPYSYCILTAHEIIRLVLLQVFGLTEQQIKDYENRPPGPIQTQMIVQISKGAKNAGGLGERCKNFLHLFAVAKRAFKGLADNALLKAWEFTLASFSETKYEFAQWNLYASLGLRTDEPGGIGQCIYQNIQGKIDQINAKAQEIQYEYEMVYTQVKTFEARMRHASTEKEAQWLKIEYQSHKHEFFFLQEQKDDLQARANALLNLYDTLYKLYVELFKDYFQEVYDADMQEVTTGPFDDSPAGYRLLFKHGRSNTSQWTHIQNHHDFINSLVSFFVATEPQILHSLEGDNIEKDLSQVVTAIINHIKTTEFIESAFHRMAAAHKVKSLQNPLQHLEQIEKKPWVYTSGGTMNTLVSCYYCIEEKPKEAEKWVENEMELLVFIADTLKQIPHLWMNAYVKEKRHALLMQSPTHAFLLKPMNWPFKETWMNEEFTYTFIRDRFVRPAEAFIESMLLNDEMLRFLIDQLSEKIPENFLPRFKAVFEQLKGPLNPMFFRDHVINKLKNDRGLRYGSRPILSSDDIDSFLYSQLPIFPIYELNDRLSQIFNLLPGIDNEKMNWMFQLLSQIPQSKGGSLFLSAQRLQDICKALLCLSNLCTTAPVDYHFHVSSAAQKLGFALPKPLIFADTNWVKDEFAFAVNPGSGKLELWRFDYLGSQGVPMSNWKQWVNGSRPDQKWGIYIKPSEYGQV